MFQFIILILIICLLIYFYKRNIEGFYDGVPYSYHWDMFKCLTGKCVLDKSYKCYKFCDSIKEIGMQENCRMRCMDYADEQFDYLKYQDYDWSIINKNFKKYSLLNDNDDYVMTR
jgi:hypothetical protein